jgi:Domain of unknown function (DUF1841)
MKYDPNQLMNAKEWSELDEGEQTQLVMEYHRRVRAKLPNLQLHCTLHVVIENQALLGDETPVAATLLRLVKEGLNRHDAIHAIAAELAVMMFNIGTRSAGSNVNEAYFSNVKRLTAAGWRAS